MLLAVTKVVVAAATSKLHVVVSQLCLTLLLPKPQQLSRWRRLRKSSRITLFALLSQSHTLVLVVLHRPMSEIRLTLHM